VDSPKHSSSCFPFRSLFVLASFRQTQQSSKKKRREKSNEFAREWQWSFATVIKLLWVAREKGPPWRDRPAHLNFHAKGNEVLPIATRNRPRRDDRDIELSRRCRPLIKRSKLSHRLNTLPLSLGRKNLRPSSAWKPKRLNYRREFVVQWYVFRTWIKDCVRRDVKTRKKIYYVLTACQKFNGRLYTQRKKSYQQLEIWEQIAPQLCIIKL